MAPILAQGLPSVGIIRTYLQSLVHGPIKFVRLNLPNLHTKETIVQVQQMFYALDPLDVTAFLICTCCESMHLELGLAGKLFDAPLVLWEVVTQSWIKHLWLTLQSLDIRIHTGIQDVMPPRVGNIEVMQLFLQHGHWSPEELPYLHAFWISDLCMDLGITLVPDMALTHSMHFRLELAKGSTTVGC